MSKPTLVFVDHSFHQKTAATQFLIELLRRRFDVTVVWNEDWQAGGAPLDIDAINRLAPDVVAFFQLLPTRAQQRRLACRNRVWLPMRDNIGHRWRRFWWLPGAGLKIVNFCRESHDFFRALGCTSHYVQYWPAPTAPAPASDETLKVLYWARRPEVDWPVVRSLLGPVRPEKVLLRPVPDPGAEVELPGETESREYHVERVPQWLEKDRYLELLGGCNVFVAPRTLEGIGQAFLEAMSRGQAVVAADAATMNEYIIHGRNGYLFDPKRPAALDFSNLAAVRRSVLDSVREGHARWLAAQAPLLDFFEAPSPRRSWLWRLGGARWGSR